MTSRGAATIILQTAGSFVLANWTLRAGVPYISLGPLPWWKLALRWPWGAIDSLGIFHHPWQTMVVLFVVYSALAFFIIRSGYSLLACLAERVSADG
jgi:hypothetical protein